MINNRYEKMVVENFTVSELDPIIDNHLNGKITPEEMSFALKKDGKDNHMKPSTYRPTTISSHIGKLLERILEKGSSFTVKLKAGWKKSKGARGL